MGSQKKKSFEVAKEANTPNFPKCQSPPVTPKTNQEQKTCLNQQPERPDRLLHGILIVRSRHMLKTRSFYSLLEHSHFITCLGGQSSRVRAVPRSRSGNVLHSYTTPSFSSTVTGNRSPWHTHKVFKVLGFHRIKKKSLFDIQGNTGIKGTVHNVLYKALICKWLKKCQLSSLCLTDMDWDLNFKQNFKKNYFYQILLTYEEKSPKGT